MMLSRCVYTNLTTLVVTLFVLASTSAFAPRLMAVQERAFANFPIRTGCANPQVRLAESKSDKEKVESLYRESVVSAERAKQEAVIAARKAAAEAEAEQRAAEAQVIASQTARREAEALAAAEKAEARAREEGEISRALAAAERAEQEAIEARNRADMEKIKKWNAETEAEAAEELARHEMDVALEKEGELAAQMKIDAEIKAREARELATVAAAEEAERAAAEARAEAEELVNARMKEEERRQDMEMIRKYAREKAEDKLKEMS